MTDEINGYSLFSEIKDEELRSRNRAVCLNNMIEAHTRDGKVSQRGLLETVQYVKEIPHMERPPVMEKLQELIEGSR